MAKALPILVASKRGGFQLLEDNLHSILNRDGIRDKPVVLISVAGAFRKGKSFLLDMMLRYLSAHNKATWLESTPKADRSGFPWQSGYRRHTTGILMWSEPIPATLPTGEEVVILLMDTQGTFDNHTTVHESSMVFALSTLLSSQQIYNLQNNLQSDDLEHLQLFTEYGRLALDDTQSTPFQKLLFLVRDWQFPDDLPLGCVGGQKLVEEWLELTGKEKELDKVRQHIRGCFATITGFLLPHPGTTVATSKHFTGAADDMTPQFAEGLKQLMTMLLSPENLTIKTIAGNPLRCRDLASFMETYVTLFKGDKLPKPKSILTATAEANNLSAMHDARSLYIQEMEALLGEERPSMSSSELLNTHLKTVKLAETAFRSRKKMGDRQMSEAYQAKLAQEMEAWFQVAERTNKVKRDKEGLMVEKHNRELADQCHQKYVAGMEDVTGEEVQHVPVQHMHERHEESKQNALTDYKDGSQEFGNLADQSQITLVDNIEASFKQMLFHNEVKKEAKNHRAAAANMKAVSQAKRSYQTMMDTLTFNQVLSDGELEERHQKAKQSAADMFDSMKEGEEVIVVGYLEALLSDLDRNVQAYIKANTHNRERKNMEDRITALKDEVLEAKKASNSRRYCVIQ